MSTPATTQLAIEYPETDGLPMAENTIQFRWIVTIKEGIDSLFRDDPNVFVAGDLFWYPVEGDPATRAAPDTMVVFGRPKGDRRSYLQWREDGIAPQVVFEVLSPSNRPGEMLEKLRFYVRFGVEEYYLYDPDANLLEGWLREGHALQPIATMREWTSPRLGIRFDWTDADLRLIRPDGRAFETFQEVDARAAAERRRAKAERRRAKAERRRADAEQSRADQEQARADQEQARADQEQARADQERARAEKVEARAKQLAARLRALGIDPETGSTR